MFYLEVMMRREQLAVTGMDTTDGGVDYWNLPVRPREFDVRHVIRQYQ